MDMDTRIIKMNKRPNFTSLKTPNQAAEDPTPVVQEKKKKPRGRTLKERGKQVIMVINEAAHKDLKLIAVKEDKQLNDLYIEAINLLLESKNAQSKADLGD